LLLFFAVVAFYFILRGNPLTWVITFRIYMVISCNHSHCHFTLLSSVRRCYYYNVLYQIPGDAIITMSYIKYQACYNYNVLSNTRRCYNFTVMSNVRRCYNYNVLSNTRRCYNFTVIPVSDK
jgi:hypothetical protein